MIKAIFVLHFVTAMHSNYSFLSFKIVLEALNLFSNSEFVHYWKRLGSWKQKFRALLHLPGCGEEMDIIYEEDAAHMYIYTGKWLLVTSSSM